MTPTDPVDERRSGVRYIAAVAAAVARPAAPDPAAALIRDLSVTGARLLLQAPVEVGEKIRLGLLLHRHDDEPFLIGAEVVRCEKREVERADLWSYLAAVHFEREATELEADAKALAEDQAKKLGIP